jgi:hypothetical protein
MLGKEMSELNRLHQNAMELAEEASVERVRGNTDRAAELLRQAFEKERQAAALTAQSLSLEPTRSVLHRSAASLALECNEIREAEKLIAVALSGNPPSEIASELRDLLEQVYFQRHLDLRGIVLQPNEFQVSITGNAVGFGVAESEVFINRVQNLEKLVFRTAERRSSRPFRERGRRLGRLARDVEVFLTVPRAASFAVSFRIGHSEQLSLPGLELAEDVIKEMLDCLELFNAANARALRERIPDPAYYRNFISLARNISPDGEAVRTVGFTALAAGQERRLILTRPHTQEPPSFTEQLIDVTREKVVVRGVLKFADARREDQGKICLLDSDDRPHMVHVPTGMMDDIVRPLWDYEVIVRGIRQENYIVLEDIRKAEEVV